MVKVNTEFLFPMKYLPLDLFFGVSWSVDVAVAARLPWETVILGTVSLTTLLYYHHLHLPSSLQTEITINYHLQPPPSPDRNIITNLSATAELYFDFITIKKNRVHWGNSFSSIWFWVRTEHWAYVIYKWKTKYSLSLGMSWDGSVQRIE